MIHLLRFQTIVLDRMMESSRLQNISLNKINSENKSYKVHKWSEIRSLQSSKNICVFYSHFKYLFFFKIMDGAGGNPGDAGGGFDPCECINMFQMNHEHAMNRLTNMLRNAQTTCTDTECFTSPLPGQPNTGEGHGDTGTMNMYLMLAIWLAIAFLLFIFRPRTIRNNREPLGKQDNQILQDLKCTEYA
ncbi:unnamed protein product [Adineta ricciae]|uniref:Small integral membrane protein 14 n=1 Tax=Adineta ricciae TaxID=249248 RepID=A0A813RNX3_ADIRI|nr:unnamed protein product [Adineta ricciae]